MSAALRLHSCHSCCSLTWSFSRCLIISEVFYDSTVFPPLKALALHTLQVAVLVICPKNPSPQLRTGQPTSRDAVALLCSSGLQRCLYPLMSNLGFGETKTQAKWSWAMWTNLKKLKQWATKSFGRFNFFSSESTWWDKKWINPVVMSCLSSLSIGNLCWT